MIDERLQWHKRRVDVIEVGTEVEHGACGDDKHYADSEAWTGARFFGLAVENRGGLLRPFARFLQRKKVSLTLCFSCSSISTIFT